MRGKVPRLLWARQDIMAGRALYFLAHHRRRFCSFQSILHFVCADMRHELGGGWLPHGHVERILNRAAELDLVEKRRRPKGSRRAVHDSEFDFKITKRFLSVKEFIGLSIAEWGQRDGSSIV